MDKCSIVSIPGAGGNSSSWNLFLSRLGMMTDTGCTPSSQSFRSRVISHDITSQLRKGVEKRYCVRASVR